MVVASRVTYTETVSNTGARLLQAYYDYREKQLALTFREITIAHRL